MLTSSIQTICYESTNLVGIRCGVSKYSFNSNPNKCDLFSNVFPDNQIAKEFRCGKTKCIYWVNYGIAPHHICSNFEQCLGSLEKEKLIQMAHMLIYVSLKIFPDNHRMKTFLKLSIHVACTPSTMHGEHVEHEFWLATEKLMPSLYNIFHEAPERCTYYRNVTESTEKDYPMYFFSHRWVDNECCQNGQADMAKGNRITIYWQNLPKNKQHGLGKPGNNKLWRILSFQSKS